MRQVKGFTGNRYTPAQKRRVTQYVQEYDHKHGRGGIAAAQRQFKVSYIALRNWLTGKNDPKQKRGQGFVPSSIACSPSRDRSGIWRRSCAGCDAAPEVSGGPPAESA